MNIRIDTAVMKTAMDTEQSSVTINSEEAVFFVSISDAQKYLKKLKFQSNYICTAPSYGRVEFLTRYF